LATLMGSITRGEGLVVVVDGEAAVDAVEDGEAALLPIIPHQIEERDPTMPLLVLLVGCPPLLPWK
jgi:hypothetical protein